MGAKTADDIQQLSSNPLVQVMLDNAGFTGVFLSLENKEIAANQIMVHEVLNKRRREVKTFVGDWSHLHLSSCCQHCSSLCNQIFPPSQEFGINPEMVKSQITLMEGEVLNNENKRNAFLWLQSYIEQLGVRTKKTGTVTVVNKIVIMVLSSEWEVWIGKHLAQCYGVYVVVVINNTMLNNSFQQ